MKKHQKQSIYFEDKNNKIDEYYMHIKQ